MNKFRIVVGDWSGDGHRETKEFTVLVPDAFTSEILGVNYAKSVSSLGIDPELFANDYEDPSIPKIIVDKLAAHNVIVNTVENKGELYIGPEDMVKIVMFLFGYQLDGFQWELEELAPIIAGGYKVAGPSSIGYGFFY